MKSTNSIVARAIDSAPVAKNFQYMDLIKRLEEAQAKLVYVFNVLDMEWSDFKLPNNDRKELRSASDKIHTAVDLVKKAMSNIWKVK